MRNEVKITLIGMTTRPFHLLPLNIICEERIVDIMIVIIIIIIIIIIINIITIIIMKIYGETGCYIYNTMK